MGTLRHPSVIGKLVNVGIQNTLLGTQGSPTPSAARSMAKLNSARIPKFGQANKRLKDTMKVKKKHSRVTRSASYLSSKVYSERNEWEMINDQDARPRSTARRNASPADCGAESLANVPAFIAAKMFAGFESFCCGCPGPAPADCNCGSGGTGGAMPLPPNEGCPKPGLNPVGSA